MGTTTMTTTTSTMTTTTTATTTTTTTVAQPKTTVLQTATSSKARTTIETMTAAPVKTSTTSTPHLGCCSSPGVDVVVVLDRSNSIGESAWYNCYLPFLKKIVEIVDPRTEGMGQVR